MVAYNVVLNSLNRVADIGTVNNCYYNFDWSIFEEGQYEVKFSFMSALSTINTYQIGTVHVDL